MLIYIRWIIDKKGMEVEEVTVEEDGGIIEVDIEGEDGIKDLIDGIGGAREGVRRKRKGK